MKMAGMTKLPIENLKFIAEDIGDELLQFISVEKRLEGISPEKRLEGISTEDMLSSISTEQRQRLLLMMFLGSEDWLKNLSEKDRKQFIELMLSKLQADDD